MQALCPHGRWKRRKNKAYASQKTNNVILRLPQATEESPRRDASAAFRMIAWSSTIRVSLHGRIIAECPHSADEFNIVELGDHADFVAAA